MKHYKITFPDGRVEFVSSEDDQDSPPGYDSEQVTIEPLATTPTEHDSLVAGLGTDTEQAQRIILERLERRAESMSLVQMRRLRRQIATMMLWTEIQRLKHVNATGNFVGLTAIEKAKQFPTLAAIAQEIGGTIPNVATQVENKLMDIVRQIVLAEAKFLVAEDAVRAATTVEEKVTAAETVVWSE